MASTYTLHNVRVWSDHKLTVTVDKGRDHRPILRRFAYHCGSRDYIRRVLRDRYGLTLPTL